jgi:flagellar biosynthesis/type III secretory pathway M-ring protein FliF/YscJ
MGEQAFSDVENAEAAGGGVGALFKNRRLLIGLGVAFVVLLVLLGLLLRGPGEKKEKESPPAVLYENLIDTQTTRVIQELSYLDIKFTVSKKGKLSTVMVPGNKVNDALQRLAQKGLPLGGSPGFELFDIDDGLGATEFDKRIKYVRAVSGEIERTISRLSPLRMAKVQIVMPEKKLFDINRESVKASVLVDLKTKELLTPEQIFGIIQLTSHSVEGLKPQDVTVVDILGNVLSQGIVEQAYREQLAAESASGGLVEEAAVKSAETSAEAAAPPISAGADAGLNWLKAKQAFEEHLRQKVKERLALFSPPESFRIDINANFKALEGSVPEIEKVECSVVIDSNDTRVFLDDIEKNKIFAAVSDAIGYKKERDQIFLRRVNFREIAAVQPQPSIITSNQKITSWYDALLQGSFLMRGLALLGLLLFLLVFLGVRRFRRSRLQAQSESAEEETIEEEVVPEPAPSKLLSLQEVLQKHQPDIQRVQQLAGENPDVFSRLVQNWLDEEQAVPVAA